MRTVLLSAMAALLGVGGCATTEVTAPPALPEVPEYVKVPHPQGYDLGDVRALFHAKDAPSVEELRDCDGGFKLLASRTKSVDELGQGARELVNLDPVGQHWCFYWSLLQMHDYVKENVFWDERQQRVIDTYSYLVPVGKAYQSEFQEPRYLQWAVRHYRQMSEWVFYRRLEIGADSDVNWTDKVANPFAHYRQPVDRDRQPAQAPVLEKYGVVKPFGTGEPEAQPPADAPVTAPLSVTPEGEESSREPAGEAGAAEPVGATGEPDDASEAEDPSAE